MDENNKMSGSSVRPYRATGNLNTTIGNPSANINDTMDINIQSASAGTMQAQSSQAYNSVSHPNVNETPTNNNINQSFDINTHNSNNTIANTINNQNDGTPNTVTTQNGSYVNKTYVTTDNKPKKKNTVSLNLGAEFKIVLLIIVILLVFVFLLPMISDFFRGY